MRVKVVVASHVVHTRFDVLALLSENYDVRYFSHVMHRSKAWSLASFISASFRENRMFPNLEKARGAALILPELTFRVLRKFLSHQIAYKFYAQIFDSAVSGRVRQTDIFHWYAGFGGTTATKLKARGAKLVCHRRALAPLAEIALMQRIDGSYKYPEALIVDNLEKEFELADIILVNSQLTADSFAEKYKKKIRVLYNCVDTDYYEFCEKSDFREVKRVGFVGSLDSRKGLGILIGALKKTEFNLELHIVGSQNGVNALEALGKELDFIHHGTLDRNSLKEFYKDMDVIVLPSYSDAYGLVAAESIACGTPAIVSNACGISELLPLNLVFESGNESSLTSKLNELLSSKTRYLSESKNLEGLLPLIGYSKYAKDLLSIYADLVGIEQ